MVSQQQNNFSPMGQGQPTSGKTGKRKNFMTDVMGMEQPVVEAVAPGIPAAQIGAALKAPQSNGNPQSGGFYPPPTSNTMPIGGQPQIQPQVPTSPRPYNPTTANVPGSYTSQIFQGFTPSQRMEGFDFSREQNTGKSAKDAFAFLANEAAKNGKMAPLDDTSPEAKQNYANWFNENIRKGMQDLGHNITDVQGDKFRFNNWQGDYWVDYGRGAGAAGGALAWQADPANGIPKSAPANDIYSQAQQQLVAPPPQQDSLEEILMALMSQNQEMI